MKKLLKLCATCVLAALAMSAFAACGGGEAEKTYTLGKITYTPDAQFNEAWLYTDDHKQYKTRYLTLIFDAELTDEAGNKIEGSIRLTSGSGETLDVSVQADGLVGTTKISAAVGQIETAEVKLNQSVDVVFSAVEGSPIKMASPITVPVSVDVVKVIKDYEIVLDDMKATYVKGEAADLTGAVLAVTYRDDTTENITVADAMTMRQFKGTEARGLDTSVIGYEQDMKLIIAIGDYGEKSQTVKYNVLPGSDWTAKTEASLDYYLHETMTATPEEINGLNFVNVSLEGCEATIQMVRDTNYDYTAMGNPDKAAYEGIINEVPTGNKPFNAFNALRPADKQATVSKVTKTRGADAIEYTVGGKSFTMYAKITAFHGGVYRQQALTVTVGNAENLTDAQKELILDLVSITKIAD